MAVEKITQGVYRIPLGFVNAFIVEDGGLTIIDTGIPGHTNTILAAVRAIGFQPEDVHQILITHLHFDHTGSLSALKKTTGAQVAMHPLEASLIRQGVAGRESEPPPGLLSFLMKPFLRGGTGRTRVEPVEVDRELQDGEILAETGGLQVIHTPGHTAGHLSFFYPKQGGVLFIGDTLTHWMGIGGAPIYENYETATKSLQKLLELDFRTVCFSHGKPLTLNASSRVKAKIRQMQGGG